MSDADLDRRVMKTLKDLGLDAAKDLKVGSPIHKYISGGQRKRLNIALEAHPRACSTFPRRAHQRSVVCRYREGYQPPQRADTEG